MAATGMACAQATAARDALILDNLSLVGIIARRVQERLPVHVDFKELHSAGTVGLIDAAAKYDAARAVRFRTYASWRIRGAILDELRRVDWATRDQRRAINEGDEIAPTHFSIEAPTDDADTVVEVAGPEQDTPEYRAHRSDAARLLQTAAGTLPPRYQRMLELYYGASWTMKQIGIDLGVRESRISQMHRRALTLLRNQLQRAGVGRACELI